MSFFQFYTGGWLKGYGVGVPNGALWTITVDIQFYVIVIFLARWLKTKKIGAWGIVIALTIIIDLLLEKGKWLYPEIIYKLLQCSLLPFIWIFLIGMFIYYNRSKVIPLIIRTKWFFVAIYLVWQCIIPDSIVTIFGGIRYNVLTTILMILSLTGIGFSYNKRVVHDYSYSFYLYHMVVINFIINNLCQGFESVWQFVFSIVASLGFTFMLAIFSHSFVAGWITKKIERKLLY